MVECIYPKGVMHAVCNSSKQLYLQYHFVATSDTRLLVTSNDYSRSFLKSFDNYDKIIMYPELYQLAQRCYLLKHIAGWCHMNYSETNGSHLYMRLLIKRKSSIAGHESTYCSQNIPAWYNLLQKQMHEVIYHAQASQKIPLEMFCFFFPFDDGPQRRVFQTCDVNNRVTEIWKDEYHMRPENIHDVIGWMQWGKISSMIWIKISA